MLKPKFHRTPSLGIKAPIYFQRCASWYFVKIDTIYFFGVHVSKKTLVSLCWEQNRYVDAVRFCLDI